MDEPSLKNFLDFRLSAGDLQDEATEHSQYLSELTTIGRHHAEVSEIGRAVLKWKGNYKVNIHCFGFLAVLATRAHRLPCGLRLVMGTVAACL